VVQFGEGVDESRRLKPDGPTNSASSRLGFQKSFADVTSFTAGTFPWDVLSQRIEVCSNPDSAPANYAPSPRKKAHQLVASPIQTAFQAANSLGPIW
jgi:hypothetical protein